MRRINVVGLQSVRRVSSLSSNHQNNLKNAAHKALMFAGQGSQRIGMGSDLLQDFPYTKYIYDEVDETLKFNLSKLVSNGLQIELNETQYSQPAILTHCIALYTILQRELKFSAANQVASALLGHSVGEYSSLYANNLFSLAQLAQITHIRGLFMREGAQYPTAMAALFPCTLEQAQKILQKTKAQLKDPSELLEIANINSHNQIVISGTPKTLETAEILAKQANVKRFVQLPVSTAFHCSSQRSPRIKFNTFLKQFTAQIDLKSKTAHKSSESDKNTGGLLPMIMNATGQPTTDVTVILENIIRLIDQPVLFSDCVDHLLTNNYTHFIELSPVATLNNFVLTNAKLLNKGNIQCHSLTNTQSIKLFLNEISR
jgi:[acyl-carrier-protein] S-malonyltransferase